MFKLETDFPSPYLGDLFLSFCCFVSCLAAIQLFRPLI